MSICAASVVHFVLCVHEDKSSIDWILRHHISEFKKIDQIACISILDSSSKGDFEASQYLDSNNSAIEVNHFHMKGYSLIDKIFTWYEQSCLHENSLIWLHPADQISVIDTNFFYNLKFRNDVPQVFSGHELFLHRMNHYSLLMSSRNKLYSENSSLWKSISSLQIQSVWWEIFNIKSFEVMVNIFRIFRQLKCIPSNSRPVLIELFLAYSLSHQHVRKRAPMICYYDVERSDTKNKDNSKRTLRVPEIIQIIGNDPPSIDLLNTCLKSAVAHADMDSKDIDVMRLLANVAVHSQQGYGKYYHQSNIYIKLGDPRPSGTMLATNIWAYNIDYLLDISISKKFLMPDLSPCPLAYEDILELVRKTPNRLWEL